MREKRNKAAGRERSSGTGRKEAAEKRTGGSRMTRPEKMRETGRETDLRDDLQEISAGLIVGRNPVAEALRSGRTVEKIFLLRGGEGSLKKIEGEARDRHIPIRYLERRALDRIADGENHQGVAAAVAGFEYCDVDDILKKAEDQAKIRFSFFWTESRILTISVRSSGQRMPPVRTASLLRSTVSAGVTAAAEKTAAGAAAYVPVARVTNIVQTTKYLQERGIWTAAADMDGTPYSRTDLKGPLALVIEVRAEVSAVWKKNLRFLHIDSHERRSQFSERFQCGGGSVYEVLRQRGIQ